MNSRTSNVNTPRLVLLTGPPQTSTLISTSKAPVTFTPYTPFKVARPSTSNQSVCVAHSPSSNSRSTDVHGETSVKNVEDQAMCSQTLMNKNNKTPTLCRNCGIQSVKNNRCTSCDKEIKGKDTSQNKEILEKIKQTHKQVKDIQRGVPSQRFYSRSQNNSDFVRYIKAVDSVIPVIPERTISRKRTASAKTVTSAECITISSDSEEEQVSTDCHSKLVTSKQTSEKASGSSDAKPDMYSKKQRLESVSALNVEVDSIRIGQMKLKKESALRISPDGIGGFVYCPHLDFHRVLNIKWPNVTKCEMCFDSSEPCIYLTVSTGALPALRQQFQMVKGKCPYYDPESDEDDERYFIIYLNSKFLSTSLRCSPSLLRQKVDSARRKWKKSSDFFQLIDYGESERRQNLCAAAALEKDSDQQESDGEVAQNNTSVTTANNLSLSPPDVSSKSSADVINVFTGTRKELFIFPPPPMKGGISVTNEDEFCLNHGECLNDVIIEFYLKYIYNEILSERDRSRSHIFSCFFYERLMQKGKRTADSNHAERRHNQVKKWTRNVDIFSKDFIFVPINEASHWYLAVICFPGLKGEILEIREEVTTTVNQDSKEETQKPDGMIRVTLPNFKIKRKTNWKESDGTNSPDTVSIQTPQKLQDKVDSSQKTSEDQKDEIVQNNSSTCGTNQTQSSQETSMSTDFQKNPSSVDHDIQCTKSDTTNSRPVEQTAEPSPISPQPETPIPLPNACVIKDGVQGSKQEPSSQQSTETDNSTTESVDDLPSDSQSMDEQVQCSKSTHHSKPTDQNHDSDESKKMQLFVMAQSGDFKLSERLKKTIRISPSKLLKIELEKVENMSPVQVGTKIKPAMKEAKSTCFSPNFSPSPPTPKRFADPSLFETISCNVKNISKQENPSQKNVPLSSMNESPTDTSTCNSSSNRVSSGNENSFLSSSNEDSTDHPGADRLSSNASLEISSLNNNFSRGKTSPMITFNKFQSNQSLTHGKNKRRAQDSTTSPNLKQRRIEEPFKRTDSSHSTVASPSKSDQVHADSCFEKPATIDKFTQAKTYDDSTENIASSNVLVLPNHPNVTVRSRKKTQELSLSNVTEFSMCNNSDSDIEVVRDSPKNKSQVQSESINMSSPESLSSLKLSESSSDSCLDSSLESLNHDRCSPTYVGGTDTSDSDVPNSVEASQGEELSTCSDNDADDTALVMVTEHIEANLRLDPNSVHKSHGLAAIKENYSEAVSHDMKNSVTVVDEVIPSTSGFDSKNTVTFEQPLSSHEVNREDTCKRGSATRVKNVTSSVKKIGKYTRPCILVFDSLRGTPRYKIAASLREYLAMEWKTRKQAEEGERIFDKDVFKMCTVPVPQQNNYTDCGLFLLHYVEKFFSNPIKSFSLPIKELEKWFNPKECSEKRNDIKNIISILQDDWISRKSNEEM